MTYLLLLGVLAQDIQRPPLEVALWPGEGVPVFEAVSDRLLLYERPSVKSRIVRFLPALRQRPLVFDSTRVRTLAPGRVRALASTFVAGRSFGRIDYLSQADYYSPAAPRVRVPIVAGDTLEYLQDRAEGRCFVRLAGTLIEASPCPAAQPALFRLELAPDAIWWIRVVPSEGAPGWAQVTDSTVRVVTRHG